MTALRLAVGPLMQQGGTNQAAIYKASALADSPLVLWMMDEGSGTTMFDQSGNEEDGTYNGATFGATAPIGAEAIFDGTNDRANGGVFGVDALQRVTVEFGFYKPSTWSNGGVFDVLVEHSPNYNNSNAFVCYHENSTITVAANRRYLTASNYRVVTFPAPAADGWHFFSMTFSIADGTTLVEHTMRINGVAVTGTTVVDNVNTANPASDAYTFDTWPMNLMSRAAGTNYASGRMAGYAMYSGHLSNTRRDAHAAAFLGS